jgi:hypothetical protein
MPLYCKDDKLTELKYKGRKWNREIKQRNLQEHNLLPGIVFLRVKSLSIMLSNKFQLIVTIDEG